MDHFLLIYPWNPAEPADTLPLVFKSARRLAAALHELQNEIFVLPAGIAKGCNFGHLAIEVDRLERFMWNHDVRRELLSPVYKSGPPVNFAGRIWQSFVDAAWGIGHQVNLSIRNLGQFGFGQTPPQAGFEFFDELADAYLQRLETIKASWKIERFDCESLLNGIDHEDSRTAGPPPPGADNTESTPGPRPQSTSNPDFVWHAPDQEPPQQFKALGPFVGTKRDLARLFTGRSRGEALDRLIQNGAIWGRQEHSRKVAVWCTTGDRYREVVSKGQAVESPRVTASDRE